MVEFSIDLEKLKVKTGDIVNDPDHTNSIIDAIIENRNAIIKHEEDHKSGKFPAKYA